MEDRRVAVGVIVYNSAADAEGTVRACLESDHRDLSVTILDNGSTDGSGEALAAAFRDEARVRVVRHAPNAGFSGGFNALREELARTGAPYAWVLADDVRVAPDALRLLVDAVAADPGVGLAGQLLLDALAPERVYFAGGWMKLDDPVPGWIEVGHEHADEIDDGTLSSAAVRPCAWVTGASMFFRAAALRDSGGMDPSYWLYFEDIDLSWRIRQAGWRIVVVPRARGWTPLTPSSDASLTRRLRYTARNRLHFMARRHVASRRALAVRSLAQVLRERGLFALARPWRGLLEGTLDFVMGRTGPIRGSW